LHLQINNPQVENWGGPRIRGWRRWIRSAHKITADNSYQAASSIVSSSMSTGQIR
jgi:hypothetical protein